MKSLLVTLFVYLSITMSAYGQETAFVEVSGVAMVKGIPEDISINIPLKVIDSSYLNCSEKLNKLLGNLQSDFKKGGISKDHIETNRYQITENIEYNQGQRVSKGYKGSVNILINQNFTDELIDQFLKTASKFQLQYTIRFVLSETQKKEMSERAMKLSVKDASEKAEILAESASVDLKEILKISYGIKQFRPGPLARAVSSEDEIISNAPNSLDLNPGEVSVNQSVLISWKIEAN